jgi:S-DNA-T family DNA segregation ATPase FtsK/SpoIIIE
MAKKKTSSNTGPAERVSQIAAYLLVAIKSPLFQQTLALLLGLVALLTFTTLVNLTTGVWINAWVNALKYLFGWGIVPVTVTIAAASALIMLNYLDRRIAWRWRPVIGLELIFFSLLALTHSITGQSDPWGLVESGWGGGLVGWAIAHAFSLYIGPLATAVVMVVILLVGIYLAFDLTLDDVKSWFGQLRRRSRSAGHARRQQTASRPSQAAGRDPARPQTAPRASKPQPQPTPSTPTPTPRPEPKPSPPPPTPPPTPKPIATPMPLAAAAPEELELPPLSLLDEADEVGLSDSEIREKSRIIRETLSQFGLKVEVSEVRRGPTVTQFGVTPGFTQHSSGRSKKVRVSQISSLSDDLALALAAPSLRIEAPVPGRSVVGIEVPNEEISLVTLRSVMDSEAFDHVDAPLAVALGQDIAGEPIVADLGLMPHLLIAGTTGSGKSVCIKALATCLAMANRPDELKMVMIDPKMVELVRFNALPHLLGHAEYDMERVTRVLLWVAKEMDERYKRFAEVGARNLDDYNKRMARRKNEEPLPRIVVFVDELADLMMLAPDQTEKTICRIAQMARATGIHLIVATQRPSVDVVTGLIKANFPARISFVTASQIDSRVILDMPGAESLLGKGDMLYLASDAGHPVRVQGCFIDEKEIQQVALFWKRQMPKWSTEAPWESMMSSPAENFAPEDAEDLELLEKAIRLVEKRKTISASYLQRRLQIGYPRAARLIEQMEEMGLVGPQKSAGRPRRVIGGDE